MKEPDKVMKVLGDGCPHLPQPATLTGVLICDVCATSIMRFIMKTIMYGQAAYDTRIMGEDLDD